MTNVLLGICLQKRHKCGISNTVPFTVCRSPYDVIEHRQKDNSSLELCWVALFDFVAELQCGESWENIPLEFHRFSVHCGQSSVLW